MFNIVSSAFADKAMIGRGRDADDKAALEIIERSPRSVSMILDPTGTVIGEPLSDSEGIVYADIDTAQSVEPKQFHDVVGYYNRFDIFDLRVDRSTRDPARFAESMEDPVEPLRCRQPAGGAGGDFVARERGGPPRAVAPSVGQRKRRLPRRCPARLSADARRPSATRSVTSLRRVSIGRAISWNAACTSGGAVSGVPAANGGCGLYSM